MYHILPDPNINKKVKLLESPDGWSDRYPVGTIGIIEQIDRNEKHYNIFVNMPPKYTGGFWMDAAQLEEVEDPNPAERR